MGHSQGQHGPKHGLCCRIQKTISLPSMSRGCHIVTRHIVRELEELHTIEVGMANFFIQHTSASLTINENASPDVPLDLNVSRLLTACNKSWADISCIFLLA